MNFSQKLSNSLVIMLKVLFLCKIKQFMTVRLLNSNLCLKKTQNKEAVNYSQIM